MELGMYIDVNVDQEIQQFIEWQKEERTKAELNKVLDFYDTLAKTNLNAKAVKAIVMIFADQELLYSGLELLERAIYDDKVKSAIGSFELYERYNKIKTENGKTKANYFLFNAALLDHSEAQLIVYEKHTNGELEDLNISSEIANELLIKSAENKNVKALMMACSFLENDLSYLFDYGHYAKLLVEVSPKDDHHYKKFLLNETAVYGTEAYLAENYDEAFRLINSIIDETNHSLVILFYIKMLYYGQGTKKDEETAIKMAEILSKVDSDEVANESLYLIAVSYLNGVVYKKDIDKGISILRSLEGLNFELAKQELKNWKKGLFGWKRA